MVQAREKSQKRWVRGTSGRDIPGVHSKRIFQISNEPLLCRTLTGMLENIVLLKSMEHSAFDEVKRDV